MKSRAYFIDLDDVVVEDGTHTPKPGAVRALQSLSEKGQIWFFSCWAFNDKDMEFLRSLGVPFVGVIRKPLADEYVYIDDRLLTGLCRTGL